MCLAVAVFVWQTRRRVVGAWALATYLLAMSWWDISYALFWTGAQGPTPHFWLDITYVGVVTTPTLFLIFTYQIGPTARRIPRSVLGLLAVEPVLVLALLFTDPWHNLFFGGQRSLDSGVILHGGPVFWFNVVYSYLLLLIATGLLVRYFLKTSGLYRRQIGLTLIGVGVTWLSSIVFVLGFNPIPDADNTPFSFSVAALIFAYALTRYRMLDVIPIARDRLLENMRDGVIVLDTRNRLLDINHAAQQTVDPAQTWRIGDPIAAQELRFPELIAHFLHSADERSEITLQAEPPRQLDLQISSLFDAAGTEAGRLIVWRDITELWQARTELEMLNHVLEERVSERTTALAQANQHLREMDQLKDEFIARIGHELRTPLTNIKLYLHLLEKTSSPQQAKYLKTVGDETALLQDLIERLLALPQLTQDGPRAPLAPIAVNDIVQQVLANLQDRIKAHGAPLAVDLEADLAPALGVDDAIQQILRNILDNSLSYAPQSPIRVTSYTGHTQGQSWICVDIVDHGPGLDDADLRHIFERFYRGSAAGTYQVPGIGMGLTTARQLAEEMDGDIQVSSVAGEETRLTLRLKPVRNAWYPNQH